MTKPRHSHRWSNWFPVSDMQDQVFIVRQCLVEGCDAMQHKDRYYNAGEPSQCPSPSTA